MKSKKGEEEIGLAIFFGVLAAMLIVAAIITIPGKFIKTKSKIDCQNAKWWDGEQSLKTLLKEVDNGEYREFMFYNKDCYLVSFSFLQGSAANKIEYPQALPREPLLCLCSIQDEACKPHSCFKFKNYEKINNEQFSTKDFEKYTFLEFIKE